jgi:alpha-beta hydrolase superfamily lysophospholipase
MIIYRTFIEKIHCLFTVPENPNGKLIINCSGLPSQPENKDLLAFFTEHGFICIHPKYEGTWESYGEFLDHSPADDITKVIDQVSKERALKSAYDGAMIPLPFNEIILFGSSLGASAALVAGAKSEHVHSIIALAPVIDLARQGKDEVEEQDLTHLGKFLQDGFGKAYNFKLENWEKLLSGKIDVNPQMYTKELSNKRITLVHGELDKTVSIAKTKKFFDELKSDKKRFISIPDAGHLTFARLKETKFMKEIVTWMQL